MLLSTNAGGLIDDEGNLFGVVNVVDALVVLLACAVLIGGFGLVLGGGGGDTPGTGSGAPGTGNATPETETTFATLDLGTRPGYIATALNEGDTVSPNERSNLTITDLYLAPQGEQIRVLAQVRLRGTERNDSIDYAGGPPRLGRTLRINTSQYDLNGQITDIGDEAALETSNTTVLVGDRVSAATASAVTPGDEVSVAGYTAATVEDVAVYPTPNPDRRRVLVEANVSSYTQQGSRRFGSTRIRTGQQMTLATEEYSIDGPIEHVDTSLRSGALTNRTVTLELSEVPEETANSIRPGQTEQVGTVPTAYVTAVDREPTPIIATAQDGALVVNDHPTLRDVTLTTELRVDETDAGIEFRGDRLQYGSTVVLDLGPVTVETTVADIGQ